MWLEDRYYLRLLHLRADAPPPPPPRRDYAGRPCGVAWCAALCDARSGEVTRLRRWAADALTEVTRLVWVDGELPPRCAVHREWPGFQPKNLSVLGTCLCRQRQRRPKKKWRTEAA